MSFLSDRRTRPNFRSPIIQLLRRQPGVILDLPRQESREIADVVLLPPPNNIIHGKGTDDPTIHNVILMSRPRKFFCISGCGERATRFVPGENAGDKPKRYCEGHAPRGILGIVQGGGDVA